MEWEDGGRVEVQRSAELEIRNLYRDRKWEMKRQEVERLSGEL